MTAYREKQTYIKSQGHEDLADPLNFHRPADPCFTQTGVLRPVDMVPRNVICRGQPPLSPLGRGAGPGLAAWLERAPTVLANLGRCV